MMADTETGMKPMENSAKTAKLQFILTGFTQELGFRVFAFERMGEDRVRTRCTVKADLVLVRRYGIRLQELPLMCRGLLERGDEGSETPTMTFSEEQMRVCADERAAAKEGAAHKRKAPRRPVVENPGAAWRGPQQY
jgi:hypothetical protein